MQTPVFFVTFFITATSLCFASDIRLKQDIIPKNYEIKLYPNLEAGTFKGLVSIDIEFYQFYNYITLHGYELEIPPGQTRLRRKTHGTYENVVIKNVTVNDDLINFELGDTVFLGEYNLEINFSGKVRDDMSGFYRSYYYYQGKKRWLGATQFEPYYARRAFPCFDEPHFRTNFTLDIVVPNTHQVISNVKQTNDLTNENTLYHFENYPRMPTYLLAWVIFERYTFVSTDPYVINGTEYRLWTQADYLNQTSHSNFVASRLLNALATFLDIPYPLKKMDQVAIPDFKAGAMENWGIVTYREAAILYAEKISTIEDYKKSTMVIAHEFTHQWFGDLVTLDWWSYTWLNEAFARYFEYFITLEVFTDWRLDEQFVILALHPAIEYDSKPQHAITSEINKTSDINNKFDMISYSKGASIVRMMENILTRQNFKAGLSKYLKNLAEIKPVATPNELFKILSSVAPSDLPYNFETIMRSWIDQPGYPILLVERLQNVITVTQKRGLYEDDSSNMTWYIPLTYTTKSEANFTDTVIRDWLTTEVKNLSISLGRNEWIIFNIQQKGFYRVNYDDLLWDAIIHQLREDHTQIGSLNRAQLINDAFFFVKAGLMDIGTALNLTMYLVNDIDYAPWYTGVNELNSLLNLFYGVDEIYKPLQDYILKLIPSVTNNVGFIGFNGDKMAQKLKRIKVLEFLGKVGHSTASAIADQIVSDFAKNSTSSYSADIQKALMCTGLKNSNDAEKWNSIYKLYQNTPYATQKLLLLFSLTCTQNSDLLTVLIKDLLADEPKIRRQDAGRLFNEIGSHVMGSKFLLDYVTNHYMDLYLYNKNNSKIIGDVIKSISGRIYSQGDIDKITKFGEQQKVLLGDTYKEINNTLESIKKRIKRANDQKDTIKNWLKNVNLVTSTTQSPVTNPTTKPTVTDTASPVTVAPTASGIRNKYSIGLLIFIICYSYLQ